MKHILAVLILFVSSSAFAQKVYTRNNSIPITQDSVTIQSGSFRGKIQWQQSPDKKNWTNLEGKTTSILKVKPDTEAMYRAVITEGTCLPVYSDTAIIEFTVPVVSTSIAAAITNNSADMGGNVVSNGGALLIERGICYSFTPNPTTSGTKVIMGNGTGIFNNTLTGLTANTTYYVRAYATNSKGTGYGNQVSFTSLAAETGTVTDIDGNVYQTVKIGNQWWMAENLKTTKYRNGDPIPNVTDGFEWNALKTGAQCTFNNDAANGNIYGKLYNWYAVNDSRNIAPNGWHVATDAEWTMLVNDVAANLGGSGSVAKALAATTGWIPIGSVGSIGIDLTKNNSSGFIALPGGFRNPIDGLFMMSGSWGLWWSSTGYSASNAWYWTMISSSSNVKRYSDIGNEGGISVRCVMGDNMTSSVVPTLSTNFISSINQTYATSGGYITTDGGAAVTARGVCWDTSGNPTIASNKTTDGSGAGSFTSSLTGLNANTTYYARAYATNSQGTGYGNEVSFKTTAQTSSLPTVTTNPITEITQNTAISGGDGGAEGNLCGVCWSTSENPTTASSKTTASRSFGSFTSTLTGLNANTTYYVRAYATNSLGTGYGNQVSFTTSAMESGMVADIDGNVYHTVTIGTQVWMVENLKTTRLNDGTSMPNVTYSSTWSNLNYAGYCWYNNDPVTNNPYGALYNWYAVNTGKLAPVGWHIPSDAEWTTLTNYLGGESVAAVKLKETGTTHWTKQSTILGTNETGFTALAGGYRTISTYLTDTFMLYKGLWWSSTEDNTDNAWSRSMSYLDSKVESLSNSKRTGFSVRCIRD